MFAWVSFLNLYYEIEFVSKQIKPKSKLNCISSYDSEICPLTQSKAINKEKNWTKSMKINEIIFSIY